jgi:hypothetical protein
MHAISLVNITLTLHHISGHGIKWLGKIKTSKLSKASNPLPSSHALSSLASQFVSAMIAVNRKKQSTVRKERLNEANI